MSAPHFLAKNIRTVGQGVLWSMSALATQWQRLIHSPYRRLCFGAAFSFLPISVGLAAYSLAPSEEELLLREQQHSIRHELTLPSFKTQISAVTTHKMVKTYTTSVRKNDTLSSIFSRLSISDEQAQRFVRRQPKARILVTPIAGTYIQAKVTGNHQLQSLNIFLESQESNNPDTVVSIWRHSDGFSLKSEPFHYETQQSMAMGVIKTNLEDAAREQGIPEALIENLKTPFERFFCHGNQLKSGDSFRLVYERHYMGGDFIRPGKILAMAITHEGKTRESFWADDGSKNGGYYNLDGTINQLAFIRVPVDNWRVTSPFMSLRKHPVTGISRPHNGTDFGAPKGTNIYAAADGIITRRRFDEDGFGNYLMVQHDEQRVTLYAHMSKFADGMNVGSRVTKGQVIGYVGATGLATGPHLHYELRLNNRQVNPMKVTFPDKDRLEKTQLTQLLTRAHTLTAHLALLDQVRTAKPGEKKSERPQP